MNASSRDFGLAGAGKGDAPRNISKKFFENFEFIEFPRLHEEKQDGFKRHGNKLTKKYK